MNCPLHRPDRLASSPRAVAERRRRPRWAALALVLFGAPAWPANPVPPDLDELMRWHWIEAHGLPICPDASPLPDETLVDFDTGTTLREKPLETHPAPLPGPARGNPGL